jgi:hypothetical protein
MHLTCKSVALPFRLRKSMTSCRPSRTPAWIAVLVFTLSLAPHDLLYAATFQPAPQRFQQELAVQQTGPDNTPAFPSDVQLLDPTPTGEPRVFAEGQWHARHNGIWRVVPEWTPSDENQFVVPDPNGLPIRVRLNGHELRQVLRHQARL